MKPRRPVGIAILSALGVLVGVITILQMAVSSRIALCSTEFIESASASPGAIAWFLRRFGCDGFLSVAWVLGLSAGVTGFGLWRLASWAWTAMVIVSALSLLDGIVQVLDSLWRHDFVGAIAETCLVGVSLCLIRYLQTPAVKTAFR